MDADGNENVGRAQPDGLSIANDDALDTGADTTGPVRLTDYIQIVMTTLIRHNPGAAYRSRRHTVSAATAAGEYLGQYCGTVAAQTTTQIYGAAMRLIGD